MTYVCANCGKKADHLSESWSTITVAPDNEVFHFCLECRSIKQVWTGSGWKEPHDPAQ